MTFKMIEGRISEDVVSGILNRMLLVEVLPEGNAAAFRSDIQAFSERLPFSVISEGVEAHVRDMLEIGEVGTRHPAYALLARLVEVAPGTRALPDRAAALLALLDAE